MKRWLTVLSLVVVGCSGTTPSDGSVHTDDTDTDVATEDTFTLGTDLPEDSDPFEHTDTDTGLTPIDTAACKFGEELDCSGSCYPAWFLGDGHCDDGNPLPADFDCFDYQYDAGDCISDTDTDVETGITGEPGCGEYTLRFWTGTWPPEVGWVIKRVVGGHVQEPPVYVVPAGTYATANVWVDQDILLPPGDYRLIGSDAFPLDNLGWWGAYALLIDQRTGQYAFETRPEDFTSGSNKVWPFSTSCDALECTVDLSTLGGDAADEMSWELRTSAGNVIARRAPGTVADGAEVTDEVQVFTGRYELALRDLGNDGWQGGRVEVRHDAGLLVTAASLAHQATGVVDVPVDCALDGQPAGDAAGTPITPTSCEDVSFDLVGGSGRDEVSWSLHRADTWEVVASRLPGAYSNAGSTPPVELDLESGRYFLAQRDVNGDGWESAHLRIDDPSTGDVLLQPAPTLPGGASGGRFFDVTCPPEHTDLPDTDVVDTDVPACLPGSVEDCDGVCFPQAFLGDGSCDDGGASSANFACANFSFDDGDCSPPP